MSRFKALLNWLGLGATESDFDIWIARKPAPEITFQEIKDVESPPANDEVRQKIFYRVMRNEKSKWALFLCPCGCNTVITLSLQSAHQPHWVVRASKKHRPSMRPSVWRDVGCLSHFWVEDGRVYWCSDTGSPPWKKQSNR